MKAIVHLISTRVLTALILVAFAVSVIAQEVNIPDPGLNAAIREALLRPTAPLTKQDLLLLNELDATGRNVKSLQGLEAASDLIALTLQSNHLANLALPNGLGNLSFVDLSFNPLTNCTFPSGLTNLILLTLEADSLTNLTLPAGLTRLTSLDLFGNRFASLNLPSDLTALMFLDLSANQFTSLNLPAGMTELIELNASANRLTSLSLPADMTNFQLLRLFSNHLTNLTLPANLKSLSLLDLEGNQFATFGVSSNLTGLVDLNLRNNQLTEIILAPGLTNLSSLNLAENRLTRLALPAGLTRLTSLHLEGNQFASLTLPPDMTQLNALFVDDNPLKTLVLPQTLAATQLASTVALLRDQGISVVTYATPVREVSVPDPGLNAAIREELQKPNDPLTELDLLGLTELDARFRNISSLQGLEAAHNLTTLEVSFNALTNLDLPASLIRLSFLDLSANQLAGFTLPAGFTNLSALFLDQNPLTNVTLPDDLASLSLLRLCCSQLTSFSLPPGLTNLALIDLGGNRLTNLTLSADLGSLTQLDLQNNQLSKLTLPVGLTRLSQLLLVGNPLTTFVLPEPLAATNLAATVSTLTNQGVSVFTYSLAVSLASPRRTEGGAFEFSLVGPPGNYAILGSTNLTTWRALATVANQIGSAVFADAIPSPQKSYRALLQGPPTNMVFISPNTFTMGSPTNEPGRNIFEGPPATVTLTRGFWIGKYEVTQGEYLAVTGENPSDFPGDLRRPISSVSWFDATNYCWKLTQQELAAGRIPPGSHYRLPTEAEWECAARAGTTTRFSYGDDDVNYTSLTNYAWFLDFAHIDLIVHPVGSKLPNPWGIYDMHGHVWEWCQDWYGDQVGGVQTDPTGPPGPVQFDRKVMRGGAYDYPNNDCRSASRFFRPANQPDSDLGFRVVLVTRP